MQQKEIIKNFIKDAKSVMIRLRNNADFSILDTLQLKSIDLSTTEIYRSIEYLDDNRLFVFDLKPSATEIYIDNYIQLVKSNLESARIIDKIYPNIFRWIFDGVSIKALAIVPSGDTKAHSTISRYGGTDQFIRILTQHLDNIAKMSRGGTPDYHFLNNNIELQKFVLSKGSVNFHNNMFCIDIDINDSYLSIIKKSINNINNSPENNLNTLQMKFWVKEINPDFIVETKHVKLKKPLSCKIEDVYDLYPKTIKNLMALPVKGNLNRFLLVRFLLSVHSPDEAKFIYYSVLSPEELEHVKSGNCKTQWNYILNNFDRYSCPTFAELREFYDPEDAGLTHPLEKIQKYMDKIEEENKNKEQ